jgi:hypothetical protein
MTKTLMAAGRLRKKNEDRSSNGALVIQVQLEGDEARRFEDYKKREFLRANSEAGRKLMLERLAEVQPAA